MVLSVPSPMHSPGLTGRRNPKSLLHGRSAKVFAVLGCRGYRDGVDVRHGRFEDGRIACSTALKSDPFRQAKTAPRPGVDSRDGDRGGGGNYTSSLGGHHLKGGVVVVEDDY